MATKKRGDRYFEVPSVFTPSAPVDTMALFAGRLDQTNDVLGAIWQRGSHAVLYGERGVGKTSLTQVLSQIIRNTPKWRGRTMVHFASVNCTSEDDFSSLWRQIFSQLNVEVPADQHTVISPEDVRHVLETVEAPALAVIIDELDRLENNEALTALADTIKTCSDHSSKATIILVGIADSVDELVGDHHSVERALTQVLMPRMSLDELMELIDKGLTQLDMTIAEAARRRIGRLSEGLPHYTHLLALHASQSALADDRNEITQGDVSNAVILAVKKAQQSVTRAYRDAIQSTRRDNLFPQVLAACALTTKDELGYFPAGAVREPLTAIMKRPFPITSYARHLKEFTMAERGAALVQSGTQRRHFYRFSNPMLQPFAVLAGLEKGWLSEEALSEIEAPGTSG